LRIVLRIVITNKEILRTRIERRQKTRKRRRMKTIKILVLRRTRTTRRKTF